MTCAACGYDNPGAECPGCAFWEAQGRRRAEYARGEVPITPRAKHRHDRGMLDRQTLEPMP